MGVAGLSAFLKRSGKRTSLSEFKGKRVAVDGNVWLHRGTYSCAVELVAGTPTNGHILYCRRMANLLRSHGVFAVVVFDGKRLPAKNEEHERRRILRARAQKDMDEHDEYVRQLEADVQSGGGVPGAQASLVEMRLMQEAAARRAVRVTDDMVSAAMADLRTIEGVEVMRAPYEADAQLAYLARHEDVHCIVTEDSDLVAYGCERVLLKLDRGSGEGLLVEKNSLWSIHEKSFTLRGFDERMLLEMCVLCGVDYLDSPRGLGIKTANKLIGKLKDGLRVIKHLKVNERAIKVPAGYEANFQQALATFLHQRVWSNKEGAVIPLEPPPSEEEFKQKTGGDLDACIGPPIPVNEARDWVFGSAGPDPHPSPVPQPGNAFHVHRAGCVSGYQGSGSAGRARQHSTADPSSGWSGADYSQKTSSPDRACAPLRRKRDEMNDQVDALLSQAASQRPNARIALVLDQFGDDDEDVFGDAAASAATPPSPPLQPRYPAPPPARPVYVSLLESREEAALSETRGADSASDSRSLGEREGEDKGLASAAPPSSWWDPTAQGAHLTDDVNDLPDDAFSEGEAGAFGEDVQSAQYAWEADADSDPAPPPMRVPVLNPFAAPMVQARTPALPDKHAKVCRPPPNSILAGSLDYTPLDQPSIDSIGSPSHRSPAGVFSKRGSFGSQFKPVSLSKASSTAKRASRQVSSSAAAPFNVVPSRRPAGTGSSGGRDSFLGSERETTPVTGPKMQDPKRIKKRGAVSINQPALANFFKR